MVMKSEVMKMEQTRGAITAAVPQVGLKNGLLTVLKTAYQGKIKRSNTGAAFRSSFRNSLGDREATVFGDKRISFGKWVEQVWESRKMKEW